VKVIANNNESVKKVTSMVLVMSFFTCNVKTLHADIIRIQNFSQEPEIS
jgi:hypothetical protein